MKRRCYGGKDHVHHVNGCRLGRPACRWRRQEARVICRCAAYHYPHRRDGGLCGNHERINDLIYPPEEVLAARSRIRAA